MNSCISRHWCHFWRCLGVCILMAALAHRTPAADGSQGIASDVVQSPSSDVLSDSVWYDGEVDRVVAVEVKTSQDDSIHRDSDWLPQAEPVPKSVNAPNPSAIPGFNFFGEAFAYTNLVAWCLLAALVVGTGVWVAWILGKDGLAGGRRKVDQSLASDERLLERVQHLPQELQRENLDYRAEAERMMQSGDFEQAIVLLFAYQLLILDRSACLRLNRGKTNRQYLKETRFADPQASEWFASVIKLFESSYFGRRVIEASDFTRCWQENEMLERQLTQRTEVAG